MHTNGAYAWDATHESANSRAKRGLRVRFRVSAFGWTGIAIGVFCGAYVGLLIGLATLSPGSVSLFGTPFEQVLLFPSGWIGLALVKTIGFKTGVLACGVSNGTTYGVLLYGSCVLANALRGYAHS